MGRGPGDEVAGGKARKSSPHVASSPLSDMKHKVRELSPAYFGIVIAADVVSIALLAWLIVFIGLVRALARPVFIFLDQQ